MEIFRTWSYSCEFDTSLTPQLVLARWFSTFFVQQPNLNDTLLQISSEIYAMLLCLHNKKSQ